ncbi:MAG: hypothetical protein ABIV25_11150 [Paracoccaceae bacterium]
MIFAYKQDMMMLRKDYTMLSILADAILIATGQRPIDRHFVRHPDADWNDRFISSRMQGLDYQGRGFHVKRDLNW